MLGSICGLGCDLVIEVINVRMSLEKWLYVNVVYVLCADCAVILVPRGVVRMYGTRRPFSQLCFFA